jgi:16S rRNA processing protein RimM
VGKVVGFFGLKGFLKVRPESNNPALFLAIESIAFRRGEQIVETAPIDVIRFNKQLFEISLQDKPTRNQVEHLADTTVFTSKNQISQLAEDEFWTGDLIGIQVFTTAGKLIGTVSNTLGKQGEFLEVLPTGAGEQDAILIPFVKQLVPLVDLRARRIEVVDLPGLVDGSSH